ncbi:MAG TPA: dihydroneopterin aldolase [Acidimicrobiales bacterium]|jgi:dihydroneopterin aldolase|nr:dihydroneopterin aldolase [Acidimicrobiales bacterium]
MPGPEAGDHIELRGLRVLGTHGALPEERHRAQPFELDLDLELDLTRAGRSDQLGDTVDYGAVVRQVVEVVGGQRFTLLEALAQAVVDTVLDHPLVAATTVVVRKVRPPVAADLSSAGVRLTRRGAGSSPAAPAAG